MALQDLTPQLRTRLSRMERAVGWFVFLATALLIFGFAYYVYHTAMRKGWFTPKLKYQTSLNNAAGLKVGDPVTLMGFTAGQITAITPNAPDAWYGVTVSFSVLKPHYGYIWDDSNVKVTSDLLGNRQLEITKGLSGVATVLESTNQVAEEMLRWQAITDARKKILAEVVTANPDLGRTNSAKFNWLVMDDLKRRVESEPAEFYTNLDATYWIPPIESVALNDRLETIVSLVEQALPNILALTNQLQSVLANGNLAVSNLNTLAVQVQPVVSNLTLISAQLREPGGLGSWALGTNGAIQLNTTIMDADTNMNRLVEGLAVSLDHLSDITSNLNLQVQANTNILGNVSQAVVHADDLVQGLKRVWFLRSAFKTKETNAPAVNGNAVLPPRMQQ